MFSSVLSYAGEVWGFYKTDLIERIHLEYLKYVLKIKKSTPNMMVYSELGRSPLYIKFYLQILKYLVKLLNTENCILQNVYKDMLYRIDHDNCNSNMWLLCVRNLLSSLGLGDVWLCHNVTNDKLFLSVCKTRLTDCFLQERNSFFERSSKCLFYKHIIDRFTLQFYLTTDLPTKFISIISKFRLSAHILNIEVGRYSNIPRQNRLCPVCNSVEDEYHFILVCPLYDNVRQNYIKQYYWRRPSSFKLVQL